jgi:hypothetical protein
MPKEVDVRKPIMYTSVAITEEFMVPFKESPKLLKKSYRLDKEKVKSVKHLSSECIRRGLGLFYGVLKKEQETGKRFKIKLVEVTDETIENSY